MDDSTDTRVALGRLLAQRGYGVQCVGGGAEALEYMTQERPDLVVLDQHMPGQSGLETFIQMRQDGRLKDIPVVFFSADNLGDLQRAAMAAGAIGWVVKSGEGWKEILETAAATCSPH